MFLGGKESHKIPLTTEEGCVHVGQSAVLISTKRKSYLLRFSAEKGTFHTHGKVMYQSVLHHDRPIPTYNTTTELYRVHSFSIQMMPKSFVHKFKMPSQKDRCPYSRTEQTMHQQSNISSSMDICLNNKI